MKNHITSLLEFQGFGLLLQGGGRHTVRVMGAMKVAAPPDLPPSKEEMAAHFAQTSFEAYYAGSAPSPTPQAPEPQVPPAYVKNDGKVVFLGRNLDEIA